MALLVAVPAVSLASCTGSADSDPGSLAPTATSEAPATFSPEALVDVAVTNRCRDWVTVRFGGEGHPSGMTDKTRIAPTSTALFHDVLAKPNYDNWTFIQWVVDERPKEKISSTMRPRGDPTIFRINRSSCPE